MEHMSEMPIKTIPPKFREMDKEIKVRVFNVDHGTRKITFTKKDSFMKEKCPVHEEGLASIEAG
jgi:hypothetical protein